MSTELIDRLIADLEHDIEILTERRRLAVELRATWGDGPAVAEEEPPPPPAAEKPAKPKKRAAAKRFVCPECDKVCGAGPGLAAHRKSAHPEAWYAERGETPPKADKPTLAAVPNEPQIPADPTLRYRCTSCTAATNTREALARHTVDQHHRGLTGVEHSARAAS